MNFITAILMAGIAIFLLTLAWLLFYRPWAYKKELKNPRFQRDNRGVLRERGSGPRSCPVCHESLNPGMSVKSRVFKTKSQYKIMHIFGCPWCWPANTTYRRICPVCEKTIPAEGFLVARFFEQPGRQHVHVLGCSVCRFSP